MRTWRQTPRLRQSPEQRDFFDRAFYGMNSAHIEDHIQNLRREGQYGEVQEIITFSILRKVPIVLQLYYYYYSELVCLLLIICRSMSSLFSRSEERRVGKECVSTGRFR